MSSVAEKLRNRALQDASDIFHRAIEPDWFVWSKFSTIRMHDMACLAAGVEPEKFRGIVTAFKRASDSEGAINACRSIGCEDEEYFSEILSKITEIEEEISRIYELAERLETSDGYELKAGNKGYGVGYWNVRFLDFSAWALSLGKQLPQGFPTKTEKTTSSISSVNEEDVFQKYTTPLLEVMKKAIIEMRAEKNHVPKDVFVPRIIEIGKEDGIDVSTNIATAIFTIIKPENHNPRKRG